MNRHATLIWLCLSIGLLPGCLAMRFVPVGKGVTGTPDPAVEVVRFPTTDNLTLEGRLFPPTADHHRPDDKHMYARLPESLKGCIVLYCHGVLDNNTSNMAEYLSDAGFRVFSFDYRGFGYSDAAELSNEGFAADATAALHYLRSRPDVDPNKIIIYGHSMGGGYAMAAGAAAEKEGKPVRAVISGSAFSNWRGVSNDFLPVIGYLLGGVSGPEPTDYAARLGYTPLLIVHAQDDKDIPVRHAHALYDAACRAHVPATLTITCAGGHVLAYSWDPMLESSIVGFAKTMLDDNRSVGIGEFDRLLPDSSLTKSPARHDPATTPKPTGGT